MKKIMLSLLLVWAVQMAMSARCDTDTLPAKCVKKVFANPEVMPQYPGGKEALMKFVNHYVVANLLKSAPGITGRLMISFMVEKDGRCRDFKVIRSPDSRFDEMVVKRMKKMKPWTPGTINGKPVRIRYCVTVKVGMDKTAGDKQISLN